MRTEEEVKKAFRFHPPLTNEVVTKHEKVRELCGKLGSELFNLLPDSAEKTLALRRLQETMFYSNAAIALNQD